MNQRAISKIIVVVATFFSITIFATETTKTCNLEMTNHAIIKLSQEYTHSLDQFKAEILDSQSWLIGVNDRLVSRTQLLVKVKVKIDEEIITKKYTVMSQRELDAQNCNILGIWDY